MQTGDWTFHHAILPPSIPGVAVIAAQAHQARRAYIFSPLTDDEAKPVVLLEPDIDWAEHQEVMNERMSTALAAAVARASEHL
jgi:hypothetical protein